MESEAETPAMESDDGNTLTLTAAMESKVRNTPFVGAAVVKTSTRAIIKDLIAAVAAPTTMIIQALMAALTTTVTDAPMATTPTTVTEAPMATK